MLAGPSFAILGNQFQEQTNKMWRVQVLPLYIKSHTAPFGGQRLRRFRLSFFCEPKAYLIGEDSGSGASAKELLQPAPCSWIGKMNLVAWSGEYDSASPQFACLCRWT